MKSCRPSVCAAATALTVLATPGVAFACKVAPGFSRELALRGNLSDAGVIVLAYAVLAVTVLRVARAQKSGSPHLASLPIGAVGLCFAYLFATGDWMDPCFGDGMAPVAALSLGGLVLVLVVQLIVGAGRLVHRISQAP